jgi:hypothetical protein
MGSAKKVLFHIEMPLTISSSSLDSRIFSCGAEGKSSHSNSLTFSIIFSSGAAEASVSVSIWIRSSLTEHGFIFIGSFLFPGESFLWFPEGAVSIWKEILRPLPSSWIWMLSQSTEASLGTTNWKLTVLRPTFVPRFLVLLRTPCCIQCSSSGVNFHLLQT